MIKKLIKRLTSPEKWVVWEGMHTEEVKNDSNYELYESETVAEAMKWALTYIENNPAKNSVEILKMKKWRREWYVNESIPLKYVGKNVDR